MMGSTEMGGTGLSDKALKALKEDNDTIKEMIQKILSKGVHAINTGGPGAT
jgi:ABC-type sulfate transport system substrate-binding protein